MFQRCRRHRACARIVAAAAAVAGAGSLIGGASARAANPPMQVGFLWHMHQPVYYPGETINQTQAAGRFSFSLYDVHNQRFGPYTSWPKDAIQSGASLPNLGASLSFSGSLIENLNNLRNAGVNGGMWNNWQSSYSQARQMQTVEGNTRLDLIGFNYHHALMPLLDQRDMRMQIKMHKAALQQTFGSGVPYSTGFFPAETAFAERMIPALVAEGFQWTLVDNIHFDRATKNYPHTNASGLYAPNRADQINPDPAASGGAWLQLNNLWAPSKVSAPFSYRPHHVQYVDPSSGAVSKIVAVPGARYEGNEDGRGGYGALQYQQVMDQYKQYNTDPAHPMLVVLHHDGDNYGGGSDAYYHNNFQNMVSWASSNAASYNVTTIADYLKKYPVAANDVIHVESGSWAGADNGDPEFKKWLADPNPSGWSPDRNSWAVLTAAKNRVFTAEDIAGPANAQNVINNTGTGAERAWHYLTQAQASDHWYWDGTEVWDSNVTRGANLAVQHANQVINGFSGNESTPPSVFVPQRDSYNPGAFEFGATPEPSDFKVWTYAYDVSGMSSVTLKWRADIDGENPLASTQNETYTGGAEVGAWNSVAMTGSDTAPPPSILGPAYRALQYAGMITGQSNKLIDYYVEAVDARGNITRSDIQHVWVGGSTTPPPPTGGGGAFVMDGALDADAKEIASNNGMKLHYSMHAGKLYVATNDAGEGSDHFIYLAAAPGALRAANWAKAGQIADWAAFLADENNNDFEGWFDATGATAAATGANGGVLEGTIDLAGEFGGAIPDDIYLAVGLYASADGGALLATHQLPGSLDGDGHLQAAEWLKLTLPRGWAIGGSGDWDTAWNWADATPNGVGAHARLLNVIAQPATATTTTPITLGQVTLASPYGYTIAGVGGMTLDVASGSGGGGASVNVTLGSHAITTSLTLADDTTFNIAPAASVLTVTQLQPTAAAITKTGDGTLEVNRIRAGSLHVNAGVARLSRDADGTASRVTSLDVATGARLDVTDRKLVVAGGDVNAVTALIARGHHAGAWDGDGVLTSMPAAATGLTSLGIATAAQTGHENFGGESVAGGDVLVMYTYAGDANLDGLISGDDYTSIDFSVAVPGASGWYNGDFNYDGIISGDDYAAIDFNIVAQGAPFPAGGSVGLSGVTSVPEPSAAVGGVSLLSALVSRRRRQRRRPRRVVQII